MGKMLLYSCLIFTGGMLAATPDWTAASGPTTATVGQSLSYTFTAHDPGGDLTELEVAWRTPSGSVYAVYSWFSLGGSYTQQSVSRTITFNQGAGTYQVWVNARDAYGNVRDPWAYGLPSERLSVNVTAGGVNGITWNSLEQSKQAGSGASVSIAALISNTGTKAWGSNHYLALKDSSHQGISFLSLSGINPGSGTHSRTWTMTAPSTPGTYYYYAQAVENGVEWIGSELMITLTVVNLSNGVTWNSINIPTSGTAGQTITFTASVGNSGTKTWGSNHYIELDTDTNPGNGIWYASLATTGAGGNSTPTFSLTLPSTPGTYSYYFRAVENGVEYFGTTQVRTIVVTAAPVVASFTASPYSGAYPLVVSFNAAGSSGPISSYSWDLDGNGVDDATGSTASKTYVNAGQTVVRLTVRDANNVSSSMTRTVSALTSSSSTYTLYSSWEYLDYDETEYFDVYAPYNGTLIAYSESDMDTYGSILDQSWNTIASDDDSGEYNNFYVTAGVGAGSYIIEVRGYNGSEEGQYYLSVYLETTGAPVPPVASFTASSYVGASPLAVTFNASGSVAGSGTIVGYAWDFDGNGTTDSTASIPSYTYYSSGLVRLTVTNSNGGTSAMTRTITVGTTPTITSPTSASGTVGSPFSYSITATNNPTSFSASGLPAGLTINTNTGVITGTPSTAQASNVTVSATNVNGTGSATLSLVINKAAQTINFGPLVNKAVTDAPFTISASASSGLPVSFSVLSGPATISGNTVTLTGVPGAVTIRAAQAGDSNYNAAPNVDQSFNVGAGTQPDVNNQSALNIHVPITP